MRILELRFLQTVFIISLLAIAWVLYVEYVLKIAPCHICLYQRLPHYFILTLISAAYLFDKVRYVAIYFVTFAYLTALFLSLAQLGLEQRWFSFDTACSSDFSSISSPEEFREKILNNVIIKCDYVSYRIMGFSLSFWNLVLSSSLFLMGLVISLPRIVKREGHAKSN